MALAAVPADVFAAPPERPIPAVPPARRVASQHRVAAPARLAPEDIRRPGCDAAFALHVPVLMYHRIVPRAGAGHSLPQLVIDPKLFAAQMDALAGAGWHTVTLRDLGADLANCTSPGRRAVVITFDDGYRDGYAFAMPVLRAHGFVATYFVITGRIDRPAYLTADDLTQMSAAGMEIGDHTVHHVGLWPLSVARLRSEIGGAAGTIQRLVGNRPESFAYPFGDGSPRAVRVVTTSGFSIAVTNHQGVLETWSRRFSVPRLRVGPGTSPSDLLRLIAPYRGRSTTAKPASVPVQSPVDARESAVLRTRQAV